VLGAAGEGDGEGSAGGAGGEGCRVEKELSVIVVILEKPVLGGVVASTDPG
jgi:hypothetical protein